MKVLVGTTNQTSLVANNATTNPKPVSYDNTGRNTTNINIPTFLVHQAVPPPGNYSNLSYEPTSVLDLQRSPSPAASTTTNQQVPSTTNTTTTTTTTTVVVPDGSTSSFDLDNLEGWDSFLSELGIINDVVDNSSSKTISQFTTAAAAAAADHNSLPDFPSVPQFDPHQNQLTPVIPSSYDFFSTDQFPYNTSSTTSFQTTFDHHYNMNPYSYNYNYPTELDFIDDLIRAAQLLLESNNNNNNNSDSSCNSQSSQLILSRLNQRLRSPSGKPPLHRAAYYFKEALNLHLTSPSPPPPSPRLSTYDVVQTIRAQKSYSAISPVPLFSAFAANQAILESIVDIDRSTTTTTFLHIVDFDIGFGGHWASLMREIAADPNGRSVVLRITAVVVSEGLSVETRLVRENLAHFARELGIASTFQIEFVSSFKSVKFLPAGEKVAVHISPSARRPDQFSRLVGQIRNLAPSGTVVVVVDGEVGMDHSGTTAVSFVAAGLEFYTAVLESLDAAVAGAAGGGGGMSMDLVRRIETYVVSPRVMAAVEAAVAVRKDTSGEGAVAGMGMDWRETFSALGMKPVGFSQFADFQAECLLRRAQVGGFHVAKRHSGGEMLLCWQDRPILATSVWRSG